MTQIYKLNVLPLNQNPQHKNQPFKLAMIIFKEISKVKI